MDDGIIVVDRGEGFWVIRRGMRQGWMALINRDFNAAKTASGAGTRAATYYITLQKRLTISAFNPEVTTQILERMHESCKYIS